jgi:hypothetical protein
MNFLGAMNTFHHTSPNCTDLHAGTRHCTHIQTTNIHWEVRVAGLAARRLRNGSSSSMPQCPGATLKPLRGVALRLRSLCCWLGIYCADLQYIVLAWHRQARSSSKLRISPRPPRTAPSCVLWKHGTDMTPTVSGNGQAGADHLRH